MPCLVADSCFGFFFMRKNYGRNEGAGAAITLTLFAAIATLSRGTYISLFAFIAVVLITGTPVIRKWAGIGILISAAFFAFTSPQIFMRFNTIFHAPAVSDNSPPRTEIWSYMLDSEVPGLPYFGIGLNRVVIERMASKIPAGASAYPLDSAHGPHNQYLALFLASGLMGLFFFFWLFFLTFTLIQKMQNHFRIFFFASLAAYLVNGIFEYTLLATNFPIALITLFAIAELTQSQTEMEEN